ncbi:MAG: peptidoglycan-binding protein [Acidimicrobiales bacterium]
MPDTVPVIEGPARVSPDSKPPAFTVHPGENEFYEVEIAADPSIFEAEEFEPGTYYSSVASEPGFLLSDSTFVIPEADWASLRLHQRLFYRIWTTDDQSDWVNTDVSVGNDNLDAIPFIEVLPDRSGRADLTPIIDHLGVSRSRFESEQNRYLTQLGILLAHHGIVDHDSDVNADNVHDLVKDFQVSSGLGVDGVPGPNTLWALNRPWAAGRNLDVVRVEADVWAPEHLGPRSHGFGRFRLRSDAAPAYEALRQEAHASGAIVTSSGSFRNIGATVTAGRSKTSFHYSGLALDLATTSGMKDADRDTYLITREGTRRWRVWAKADQGETRTLDAVIHHGGSTTVRTTTARVIDFTELMEAHGFSPIGQRSCFPGNYLCAEWWHFQYEVALTPWVSQFGAELLSLSDYSEDFLDNQTDIWAERKRIFQARRRAWR